MNQNHPQTLTIGVILLYFDAFFLMIGGGPVGQTCGLVLGVASVAAGAGIANDKRVAWYLGVALSMILPAYLLLDVYRFGLDVLFNTSFLINAVFPVAQLTALAHPMSRSHVKIWFE